MDTILIGRQAQTNLRPPPQYNQTGIGSLLLLLLSGLQKQLRGAADGRQRQESCQSGRTKWMPWGSGSRLLCSFKLINRRSI